MSLKSLNARVRKLERKSSSRWDKGFTLVELCRVMWTENKENFKELAQETSLGGIVGYLQAEDAMRDHQQRLREAEEVRFSGRLPGDAQS